MLAVIINRANVLKFEQLKEWTDYSKTCLKKVLHEFFTYFTIQFAEVLQLYNIDIMQHVFSLK